ncbi:MAG: efflux RND transporter periplasmic adaptor subunit [Bacteroidota bacterium]
MTRNQIIGMVVGSLLLGGVVGFALRGGGGQEQDLHSHEEEEGIYTCSMHPQVRQQGEGLCPICGMDLIPVLSGTTMGQSAIDQVNMTAEAKALAQVQTVPVRYRPLAKNLQLAGSIAVNTDQVQTVPAWFGGRVESMVLSQEGDEVQRGQQIARLYAPEWVTAQHELLEAQKAGSERTDWLEATKQKLINIGVSPRQIAQVLAHGETSPFWTVQAPATGVVLGTPVRVGEYLQAGESVFTLASLDNIWVELEAFAQDLPWVQVGDTLAFSVEGAAEYQAIIREVDPIVEGRSRTATLRAAVMNDSGALRPGMLVSASLQTTRSETPSLVIPKSSVLWTGTRSVVWVEEPFASEPTFSFREVTLGEAGEQGYIVRAGLREGERVVAQGVFAVDATAQLAGHRSMMQPDLGKEWGGDFKYSVPLALQARFASLLDAYLGYKDALVLGQIDQANAYLPGLFFSLDGNTEDMEEVALKAWENYVLALKEMLPQGDLTLTEARALLDPLSKQMYALVKSFDWGELAVYYQYCPMALEDQGAYWLSKEKEIRNPYFGDAMLACGEVREYVE